MALFMLMNGVVFAHADYDDGMECPVCGKHHWDDWVECYDCGMCIDCAADYICPYCGECTYCAGDRCGGCGACPDCGEITPSVTADSGAEYTVKYSSSNTKAVSVDNDGNVKGLKRGSSTITCTVIDSNGTVVQDTCTVTVKYTFWQWLIKILLFGWIWY